MKKMERKRSDFRPKCVLLFLLLVSFSTTMQAQTKELTESQKKWEELQKEWRELYNKLKSKEEVYLIFDYSEYVKFFTEKAQQKDHFSQCKLGIMYDRGWGVEKDYNIAAKYFTQAAIGGEPEAQYMLYGYYRHGTGVSQDDNKSRYWLRKAADNGSTQALYYLGISYSVGEDFLGIEKDDKEAFKYFLKSAMLNHISSIEMVAGCYLNDRYYPLKNIPKAIEWYEKAAALGSYDAFVSLGDLFLYGKDIEQDVTKAVSYYKKAVDLGSTEAELKLAEVYFYKDYGSRDINQAIFWLRKAINDSQLENVQRDAKYLLGCLYFDGLGVDRDDRTAFSLFRAASNFTWGLLGYVADAQAMVGYCYENGFGVTANFQEAVSWYEKSVKNGNIFAMANLGYFYENGVVVEKDEKKAFEYYKQSAEQGESYGQRRLAFAYYYGIGTPKNNEQALYWMKTAKDNGDSGAEDCYETLLELTRNNDFNTNSSVTILMEKRNSVYYVPCKINGVSSDFIFDTGAGSIFLSAEFAKALTNTGLLSESDYIGETKITIADGSSYTASMVNIRDVEIGGMHLFNVTAVVNEHQNSPLLLGQSAIEKLGKVTIDKCKLIINKY